MKYILVFLPFLLQAQIGINTSSPKATLDISSSPSEPNKIDGFLPPRLSLNDLSAKTYGDDQIGTMLYVTDVNNSTVLPNRLKFVTSTGYYYFDNDKVWKPFESRTGSVIFTASKSGTPTSQTIPSDQYTALDLDINPTNSTNPQWDNSLNRYTIPISGKYLVTTSINLTEGVNSPRNIYVVLSSGAVFDTEYGNWQTNEGSKYTIQYTRLDNFTRGDSFSVYIFSRGLDLQIANASFNIVLLSVDPD